MNEDLSATIHCSSNGFTRVEHILADYVLSHCLQVSQMSISQLAAHCGVSGSTVYRFCRRLGLDGYREFCMALALCANKRNEPPTDAGMSERVYSRQVASLTETYHLLDMSQMEEASRLLLRAEHVLLAGSNLALLSVIYRQLIEITPCVIFSQSERAQAYYAQTLTQGDMLLAFSHQGTAEETISAAQSAKTGGACVLAFTHFYESPLSGLADYRFLSAETAAAPMQSASLLSSYAFLTELLCTVCRKIRSP